MPGPAAASPIAAIRADHLIDRCEQAARILLRLEVGGVVVEEVATFHGYGSEDAYFLEGGRFLVCLKVGRSFREVVQDGAVSGAVVGQITVLPIPALPAVRPTPAAPLAHAA